MGEEKLNLILESMQGITYLEWTKLAHVIEETFECELANLKNGLQMANPDVVNDIYKRLF